MKKKILYKPIIKWITTRVVALLVMAFLLYILASPFTGMLLTNRLDETGVSALKHTFHALPFESNDIVSNVTGEKTLLLNVTFQAQRHLLYSEDFTSEEIRNVGVLERDGQIYLTIWSSEAKEDKEYVIYGNFRNFYKYGTREKMPLLLVDSYHEVSLLDEFISANGFLLSHVMIGLIVFTAACVLVLLGSVLWFIGEPLPEISK